MGGSLLIGAYALASGVAELSSLPRPPFPSDPANLAASGKPPESPALAFSAFRSDLSANTTLTDALSVLQPRNRAGQAADIAKAQAAVAQTVAIAPYHSELWLALALLQAKRDPRDPIVVEALKMSYFTAPSDPQLMPVRLDTATLFDALSDPDLKELVSGDLRLMLSRQATLKPAVASAYRRASSLGKAFLDETVQSIDPTFIPALHGLKPA